MPEPSRGPVKTLPALKSLVLEFKSDVEKPDPATGVSARVPIIKSGLAGDKSIFEIFVNGKFVLGVDRDKSSYKNNLTNNPQNTNTNAKEMASDSVTYEMIKHLWYLWVHNKGYQVDYPAVASNAMDTVRSQLPSVCPQFVPLARGMIFTPNAETGTMGVGKYIPESSRAQSVVKFVYNPWFVVECMVLDLLVGKATTLEGTLMYGVLHEISHVYRGHVKFDSSTFSGLNHGTENLLQDVGINNFCCNKTGQPVMDSGRGSGTYVDLVVGSSKQQAEGVATQLRSLISLFVASPSSSYLNQLSQISPGDLLRVVVGSQVEDTSQIIHTLGSIVKFGAATEVSNVLDDIKQKLDSGDVDVPDNPNTPKFNQGDIIVYVPIRYIFVVLGKSTKFSGYYDCVKIGSIMDRKTLEAVSSDPSFGQKVAKFTVKNNQDVFQLDPADMVFVPKPQDLHPTKVIAPGKLVATPDGKVYRVISIKGSDIVANELSAAELSSANAEINSNPREFVEKQIFGAPSKPLGSSFLTETEDIPVTYHDNPDLSNEFDLDQFLSEDPVRNAQFPDEVDDTQVSVQSYTSELQDVPSDYEEVSTEPVIVKDTEYYDYQEIETSDPLPEPSLDDYGAVGRQILDADI